MLPYRSSIALRSISVTPSLFLRYSFVTGPLGFRFGSVREARCIEEVTEEQRSRRGQIALQGETLRELFTETDLLCGQ